MSILATRQAGRNGIPALVKERHQVGKHFSWAVAQRFGCDGTGRNSPVLQCRNVVLSLPFIFPTVHRAGQRSSPCPAQGEEESRKNQLHPHSAGPPWRVFLHFSFLNCFEWADIHMVQNRSKPFMQQKSPSFSSPSPSFHLPSSHWWSQPFVFVGIHLEFT